MVFDKSFLIIVILLYLLVNQSTQSENRVRMILNNILQNYTKEVSPTTASGNPVTTDVNIGFYFNDLGPIDEINQEFSVNMYFRQQWKDKRLAFKPVGSIKSIRMGHGVWDKIWTPDVFFRDLKRATFDNVMRENRLLMINSTGFVYYVTKLAATFSCEMKFHRFPFDKQTCPLIVESFGYTLDNVNLKFMEVPVSFIPKSIDSDYTLESHILEDCSQNYTAGAFPCIQVNLVFKRLASGHFLRNTAIPSIIFVVMSWLTLLFSSLETQGRLIIGFVTTLLIVLQKMSSSYGMNHDYIKAIDVWTLACLLFIVFMFLESVIVIVLNRLTRQKKGTFINLNNENTDEVTVEAAADKPNPLSLNIDRISMILFPLSFILFLIIYFSIYLS